MNEKVLGYQLSCITLALFDCLEEVIPKWAKVNPKIQILRVFPACDWLYYISVLFRQKPETLAK